MSSKSITRAAIRDLMTRQPGITQAEIADYLGIGRNTVNRHVKAIRLEWQAGDVE